MSNKILVIYLFLILAAGFGKAQAQDSNFIFGEVVLKNQEKLTGIIRFSKSEVFWTDVLYAKKNTQGILSYLNEQQRKALEDHSDKKVDWAFLSLWQDKLPEKASEALCRFGDISSIHITGEKDMQIYLKNGSKIRASLPGGWEAGSSAVEIFSTSSRKIGWKQISRFNFRSTEPQDWKRTPLYGTVYTSAGSFKGYISWGLSKFLTSQTLYGKNQNTIAGIKFSDIARISRKGSGAVVQFNSGKQVFLTENPDVSMSSPGIAVAGAEGRKVVSWSAFLYVKFESPEQRAVSYSDFKPASRIYAEVSTRKGLNYKGRCTFDLDEEWRFEMLEGSSNGVLYQIPFAAISSIGPAGPESSRLTLRDGTALQLRGNDDVDNTNWGMFIWPSATQRKYIPWRDINTIKIR